MEVDLVKIEKQLTFLYSKKRDVTLSEIPSELQEDFQTFFIGKTFTIKNKIPHFHFHDFRDWFNKVVYSKGIAI